MLSIIKLLRSRATMSTTKTIVEKFCKSMQIVNVASKENPYLTNALALFCISYVASLLVM